MENQQQPGFIQTIYPPYYIPIGDHTSLFAQSFEFDIPAGGILRISSKKEDESSPEP